MMMYPGVTAPGMYALSARLVLHAFVFETVPTPATYRSAGYGVCAENVIDGAKCIFGAHKIRKRLVQEVHPDGHVNHGARSAPGAQAGRHAERGGV